MYRDFSRSAGRFDDSSLQQGKILNNNDIPAEDLSASNIGFSLEALKPNTSFHIGFLRDSCSCTRCVDASTSQKLFETAEIPINIKVRHSQANSDGSITVEWQNDIPGFENHLSTYPNHFFKENSSIASRLRATYNVKIHHRQYWDRDLMASQSTPIDYTQFIGSSAVLFSALMQLQKFGLIFLYNVPSEPDAINHIASRIGPIRNTFYGPVWDVRSVPSAKNLAYTSSNLGFHMDLLYMEDPPGLQLLHCLKASETGGESLFSDTFRAVTKMKQEWTNDFRSLLKFQVTYRYKNDGVNYQHSKPTVEMIRTPASYTVNSHSNFTHEKAVRAVNWSPPFQAPLLLDIGSGPSAASNRLSNYIKAAKIFKGLIEDPASVYETKMEEGTCVIFNNRRVVHARRAFDDKEGKRWLRGAYVDTDAFNSRLRTLEEEQKSAASLA